MKGRTKAESFSQYVTEKIFGPKKVEVEAEWRKLRTEELHDLHSSSHIIRVFKIKQF